MNKASIRNLTIDEFVRVCQQEIDHPMLLRLIECLLNQEEKIEELEIQIGILEERIEEREQSL